MSKTVLITGAAGFIGSTMVRYLHNRYPDYRLLLLDALTYAASVRNLPKAVTDGTKDTNENVSFWYGNVCNAELVDSLVSECDVVLHFAAETHVTRSIYDNLLFFQTDVLGTHAVANAILKARDRVERFIHISTSEVYGTAESETMDEDHPLNPMSPYASAKCGADRLVYSYWRTYDLPAVIVRPFNNYGPRQHLEKVIPRFVTSVLLGEPLNIHGDGTAARDFVYVEDVCRAIDLAMHAPREKVLGEAFNVASGRHRSINEIAEDIVRVMDAPDSIMQTVGNRPGQVFRHTGSSAKIQQALGWKPRMGWEDGLKATVDWFSGNRDWWRDQVWMRRINIRTAGGNIELH